MYNQNIIIYYNIEIKYNSKKGNINMIYDISKVNIGKINFNEISLKEDKVEKESKYPNFPKIGEMVVEVYNLEGNNIPHFHINGQGKSICIQIYDNRYFKHGKHKDTFTNSK